MNTTHQTPQESLAALSALSDDALKLLSGLEIRSLTENQLKALTPKQIASFSIAQLISLTKAQFLVFSQEQLAELNDSQKTILGRHQVNVYRSLDVFNDQYKEEVKNSSPDSKPKAHSSFETHHLESSKQSAPLVETREVRGKAIADTLAEVGVQARAVIQSESEVPQSNTYSNASGNNGNQVTHSSRSNAVKGLFGNTGDPVVVKKSNLAFEHPFIKESAYESMYSKPIELPQPVLVGDRLYGAKKTQVKANIERVYTPSLKSICLFWACIGLIASSDLLINAYSSENDPITIVWSNADKRTVTPDTSLQEGGRDTNQLGFIDSSRSLADLPLATSSNRGADVQDEDARLLASLALPPESATAGSSVTANSLGMIPAATFSSGKVSTNLTAGPNVTANSNLDSSINKGEKTDGSERSQLIQQASTLSEKVTPAQELSASSKPKANVTVTSGTVTGTETSVSMVSKLTAVLTDKISKALSFDNEPLKSNPNPNLNKTTAPTTNPIKIEDFSRVDAYEPFLTAPLASNSQSKLAQTDLTIKKAPIALTGGIGAQTDTLPAQTDSVKLTSISASNPASKFAPLKQMSKDLEILSTSAVSGINRMLSKVEISKLSKWMNSAQLNDVTVAKSTIPNLRSPSAETYLGSALSASSSIGSAANGKEGFQPLTVAVFDTREQNHKANATTPLNFQDNSTITAQLFNATQDLHGTAEIFNKDTRPSKVVAMGSSVSMASSVSMVSGNASSDADSAKAGANLDKQDKIAASSVAPVLATAPVMATTPNSTNPTSAAANNSAQVFTALSASPAIPASSLGASSVSNASANSSAQLASTEKSISSTLRLAQVIDLSTGMPKELIKDLPKVVSKVSQPDKYNSSSWTTMTSSADLPPRVAALGEDLISAVKHELPGGASLAKPMPYEEFKLRVKEAVGASPDVGIASSQVGQAKAVRSVALSGLLPQVSGSVNNGSRTVGRDPFLGTSAYTRNGAEYGVTVSQLLFDFGSTLFGVKSGKARELASQELLNSKRSEQALNCINAFIELERAKAHMNLAQQNASSRLAIVQLVKERSELGGGSRADIIRAESKYAEALSQISITETRLNAAEAAYRAVFYSTSKVIVNGPLHEFPIDGLSKTAEELASSYPGLAQLSRLREAADMDYNSAVSKALPSFSMVYSNNGSGYNATNISPSTSSSVILQVKYDFYTGGADTARKQDAMFKSEQARNEFESGMLQYQKVLSQTQAEIRNNEELMAARRASTNSAVDSMRAVREQFAFNKGSLLDLITVQESLLQAGNDLIDAKFDRALARYRLLHLTSELDKMFDLNYKFAINAID